MQEITQWDPDRLLPVFGGLSIHLAVTAVLCGAANGRVWVDHTTTPQAGVIWTAHRVFVAGEDAGALNACVRAIAVAAQARGDWGMGVYGADGAAWDQVLHDLTWRSMAREYWEGPSAAAETTSDATGRTGEADAGDLRLHTVNAELLTNPWARLEQLREEMCSERASVDDFLARSFGVCLVDETAGTLAGWCLSEYNCGARCEVGIEVLEAYQRRGLGTRLTRALCAEAAARGVERVGWHCLAANKASGATARAAGLALATPYTAAVVLLGDA